MKQRDLRQTMRLIARKRYWLVIIGCPVLEPRKLSRRTRSIRGQLVCLCSWTPAQMRCFFFSVAFLAQSIWLLHLQTKLFPAMYSFLSQNDQEKKLLRGALHSGCHRHQFASTFPAPHWQKVVSYLGPTSCVCAVRTSAPMLHLNTFQEKPTKGLMGEIKPPMWGKIQLRINTIW